MPSCLAFIASSLCLLILPAACTTTGGSDRTGLPPYLQRMRDTYPDAQSGRFMALAHFERPNQPELFRIVDATGQTADVEQPSLSVLRSRNETGSGGLYAYLPTPQHELRFDGARSSTLALLRDWRDYHVLLMSLYGPAGGLRLRFSVHSGDALDLAWTRTLDVAEGWNSYRFDLAEIADTIDLADVRSLRFRLIEPTGPAALFVDDVIIADNTAYLWGEDAAPGELFVFEQGRRLHVGVRDRYELAFADGLIVEWYDQTPTIEPTVPVGPTSIELEPNATSTTAAPARPNLAPRNGVGPHPVPLADDWFTPAAQAAPVAYDDPNHFAPWGAAVQSEQWLREASDTRVVVQSRWRFLAPGRPAGESPAHTWQYVIYPSGEVFVTVASSRASAAWTAPHVGYAVAVRGRHGFRPLLPDAQFAGALLTRPSGADLAWLPHQPALADHSLALSADGERRLAVLLGDTPAAPIVEAAALLRCWPTDINTRLDAASYGEDYQHPPNLTLAVGTLRTDIPGDLNADGYNEAEGCQEIALVDGAARFRLDPGGLVRHVPRLRLHGSADRRCWTYVDGQRMTQIGRDRNGDALLTLPRLRGRAVEVEVHTLPREARPPAEPAESAS